MSILRKMFGGLKAGVDNALKAFSKIDDQLFDELEEALIMADIGVETASKIIESLRELVKKERIEDASGLRDALVREIGGILESDETVFGGGEWPLVVLVVGVNGAGKTTTIGKLAHMYTKSGKTVVLAAGDTFRAAATEQLEVWAHRASAGLVKHQEGADPGAVLFDAIASAKAKKADVLICDTAGRLHNKKNLMNELGKLGRILENNYPEAKRETLLVLDATTGQNALSQARIFGEAVGVSGIVLTKLDGTAKGGIVVAIHSELGIPVRFIGLGEKAEDMQEFVASEFAKAII